MALQQSTSWVREIGKDFLTFTFRNVTVVEPLVWVGRVAPGAILIAVRVPAVVLLQSLCGIFLRVKAVEDRKGALCVLKASVSQQVRRRLSVSYLGCNCCHPSAFQLQAVTSGLRQSSFSCCQAVSGTAAHPIVLTLWTARSHSIFIEDSRNTKASNACFCQWPLLLVRIMGANKFLWTTHLTFH
jgi:hypothetical protein